MDGATSSIGSPGQAKVIVYDPEPIVGIALLTALSERGCTVTAWVGDRPMPPALLDLDPSHAAPIVAVIDPVTDAGEAAAHALMARGVLVLIHSAVAPDDPDGWPALRGAPRVGKPALPDEVAHALAKMFDGAVRDRPTGEAARTPATDGDGADANTSPCAVVTLDARPL